MRKHQKPTARALGAIVFALGAGLALRAGGALAAGPAVVPPTVTLLQPDAPPTADTVPLAAHRASYRVSLLKSTGSKSPTNAKGQVSYEFSGSACEGYTQ